MNRLSLFDLYCLIIQQLWPYILAISAGICLLIKTIKDELDYRKWEKEQHDEI